MSSWFVFTDRWTVTVASSGRRKIRGSDLHENATQRKDVVNCRDEIRFWKLQVIEDFHSDRAVSRWLLVVPTCLSVCYMEMRADKAVVAVLHRESKSVDNGGASAQGRRRPGLKIWRVR